MYLPSEQEAQTWGQNYSDMEGHKEKVSITISVIDIHSFVCLFICLFNDHLMNANQSKPLVIILSKIYPVLSWRLLGAELLVYVYK